MQSKRTVPFSNQYCRHPDFNLQKEGDINELRLLSIRAIIDSTETWSEMTFSAEFPNLPFCFVSIKLEHGYNKLFCPCASLTFY